MVLCSLFLFFYQREFCNIREYHRHRHRRHPEDNKVTDLWSNTDRTNTCTPSSSVWRTGKQKNGEGTIGTTKAVPLVPFFVELAIEFTTVEEDDERGGRRASDEEDDEILWRKGVAFSRSIFAIIVRGRTSPVFFQKDDIQADALVPTLCCCWSFPDHRFRFWTAWDPASLWQTNLPGSVRLHLVAVSSSVSQFPAVGEAVIRYAPSDRGFTFQWR